MNDKFLIMLCRISIIFIFFVGLCVCFWWYPFSISFSIFGITSREISSLVYANQTQAIAFWSQLIFAWLIAIPCFSALVLVFKSVGYAKCNQFFTKKNAGFFRVIAVMLFIDFMLYITGNIVFMFLGWNPFALLYFVIGVLGIIFALACYFAYRYIDKAASLKEEMDSFL